MNTIERSWWLPITNWCLNEIFATESISPNVIYRNRKFGSNINYTIDDNGFPLHLEDALILYPHNFYFKPLIGYPIQIYVKDSYFDPSLYSIDEKSGIAYYKGTIYLRRGNFQVRFFDESVMRLFFAQSMVSLEAKTINKYNLPVFEKQGVFHVTGIPERQYAFPSLTKMQENRFNTSTHFDKALNHIKGFYYGFIRADIGNKSDSEFTLEENIATLKSKITALRTFLEMSPKNDFAKYESLIDIVTQSEEAYKKQYNKDEIQFNIIRKRIKEIYELQNLRLQELEEQKIYSKGVSPLRIEQYQQEEITLKAEKEKINNALEVLNQQKEDLVYKAKQIIRPKKHSSEYNLKKEINDQLEEVKESSSQIKSELKRINDELRMIWHEVNKSQSMGKTKYDSSIEDQFYRITSSVNDLLLSAKKDIERQHSSHSFPDLRHIKFNIDKLAAYFQTLVETELDGSVTFYNSIITKDLKVEEQRLFHLIIETVLKHSSSSNSDFSDSDIQFILHEVARRWKKQEAIDDLQYDIISKQLMTLENYIIQRDVDIEYPGDFHVLNSFTAFILKPGKPEELERFMNLKKLHQKQYAFAMWGCFVGFAAMPKTFTNLILESANLELIEGIDEILFNHYIKRPILMGKPIVA